MMKTTFGRVDSLAQRLVDKAKQIRQANMPNLASESPACEISHVHVQNPPPLYDSVSDVPTTTDD